MGIADRRIQYETAGLDIDDLDLDPITQLNIWYRQAEEAGVAEPNAMVLSTVDSTGQPDSRVLLARAIDTDGITFFSNRLSAKGKQIIHEPRAAATFAWLDLHRQVRIHGVISQTIDAISDTYFASRPRASQIGAWASPQSTVINNREQLDDLIQEITDRFEHSEVPRPAHWGGYVLSIDEIEFWQGRPSRLHDRIRYTRNATVWRVERLAP